MQNSKIVYFKETKITESCDNIECIWKVPVLPSRVDDTSLKSIKELESFVVFNQNRNDLKDFPQYFNANRNYWKAAIRVSVCWVIKCQS